MEWNAGPKTKTALLDAVLKSFQGTEGREFVDTYWPLIYNWCRCMGLAHSDAEDVVTEVWMKVLVEFERKRYSRVEGKNFRGWLRTIAHNLTMEFYRRCRPPGGRQGKGGSSELERLGAVADPRPANDELAARLRGELDRRRRVLDTVRDQSKPETWAAFEMTKIGKIPGEEVAARLGIDEGAVYSATYRIKKFIATEDKRLRDLEEGED